MCGNLYGLNFPTFGFCLPVFRWSDKERIATMVHKIVELFCIKSVPHNIFWTWGTHHDQHLVKIFIFPRSRFADKVQSAFNVAFCELVGYVPVGGELRIMWFFHRFWGLMASNACFGVGFDFQMLIYMRHLPKTFWLIKFQKQWDLSIVWLYLK